MGTVKKTGSRANLSYQNPGGALGGQKRSLWERLRGQQTYMLMSIPMVVFFIIFSYIPMYGIYYAFVKYDFAKGFFSQNDWIGFSNFEYLFYGGLRSPIWQLISNTLFYNVIFLIFCNVTQIAVAVVLKELTNVRIRKVAQTMTLFPHFISMVLVAVFVYNLLSYDFGAVNGFFKLIGAPKVDFYAMPGAWRIIIPIVKVWKDLGFGSIVYFAALTGIDESIYEAAYVDGATVWKRIRYITLPLLKPTVVILLLFAIGGIMKGQFDLFYQLVGRNGTLFGTTDIIDTFVYRSLAVTMNLGLGTAAGLVQSVFGLVLVMVANFAVKKVEPDYALY